MATFKTETVGRLGLSGFLTYHDKDGAVIKTVEMTGSVPLSDIGLTVAEATEIINAQKDDHGTDDQ